MSDCEGEAAETQVWLDFALRFDYIDRECYQSLFDAYNNVLGKLVNMINSADKWKV